ncbi:hypothetical protein CIHG_09829 [Coccidioides immitis H538.4]|uniref:C2H2-type domain-containing protein n=1 Tax=Coccidioides immitis H538.4 TaxID=396776 RepID=A0A0J8S4D6_COCIT|nr:hypothetical protein CIHG_09829 [Coccidioides immitis H538.4]
MLIYECENCSHHFNTQCACEQHMNNTDHWLPEFECETCSHPFKTQRACEQHMDALGHQEPKVPCDHLNSRIHRGASVPCHFCGKKYTSASSVTHHLELGSCRCAKGVNHTSILHAIQQRDPHHIITDKQIEWYKEDVSKYLATDLAYNGFFWECYLCHAEFGTKGALNAHINSPAHSQRMYHCPKCRKKFKSLAGLLKQLCP